MTARTLVAVALVAVLSLAGPAPAQPLADRLPADAVVYVGWAGADSMGPGFEGSHLKAMLDAGEVPRVVNEVIPKLLERLATEEPQAAQVAGAASDVLQPLWRHPTALYIGPVDMANPRQPMPRVALLCDAGEHAAALRARLEEFVQQAGGNVPLPLAVRTSGNVVALVVGRAPGLDAVFDGKANAKSLAGAKNFTAAMSMQKSPVVAAYVDVEAVVRFVDEAVAKGNDAEAKQKWPPIRDALGLAGLKRAAFAQGFDGKEWATHAFVEAPAPRKGLAAALEAKPIGDAVLRAIPVTSTVAGVARVDLGGLLDGVRQALGKIDPNAGREMDEGLKQLNDLVGLDVRRDVLAPLGDEWAYYIAPEVTGRGPLGVVVVNRLKDAAKAQAAADKLRDLANQAIARHGDKDVRIAFKQAKVGDVTVHYLAIPMVTPSWAIQNGNLYVGVYPQVVAEAATHVSREGKSILDNPAFVALRKRLGGERATSVQFYDLPKSAPTSYQVWMFVASLGKFGDLLGVDTPVNLLPPLSKLTQHLTVAGAVTWVDDAGWHYRAVTPFPGGTMLASETAGLMDIQTAGFMAGLLVPALSNAREQAKRVQSMSNLRQIGLGAVMYANENKGKFPDDLAQTYPYLNNNPQTYVNPRAPGAEAVRPQGLAPDALKRWINESSGYVYVGKGKTMRDRNPHEIVIAHERPDGLSDGLNLVFADGHAEFQRMDQAMQSIEKSRNAAAGDPAPAKPEGGL